MATRIEQVTSQEMSSLWAMKKLFIAEDNDLQPNAKDAIGQLLQHPEFGRAYFVINESRERVGYLLLCFGFSIESGGRDAFVDELFILKEHRGCGHGGTAMELLIPEAKMLGINKLFLEVSQDNQAALEIYRRVGFQMRKHYQLMELPL